MQAAEHSSRHNEAPGSYVDLPGHRSEQYDDRPHRRRMYVLIGTLGILALAAAATSLSQGFRLAQRRSSQMAALTQVMVHATSAHLWLEEIVVGDSTEDISIVWQLLDLSDSCATMLLEGGECAALGHVAPVEAAALRTGLAAAKATLGRFSEILRERYAEGAAAGPGSRLDQLADSVFTALQVRLETAEVGLRRVIAGELRAFRVAELSLIISIVLVVGLGMFLLWQLEHRRKLLMTNLHVAFARNRALLSAMPDMIFRVGADGSFLEFVPGGNVEPLVSAADFLHKKVAEVMPADLAKRMMQDVARTIETGEARCHEYTLPSGGEERDYEYRLIRCAKNEALAIVRDITERKRAEEAAARFSRVIEGSLNEIYIFDAETLRFVAVNRGARGNLGYSLEELRSLTPLDLKPEFTAESFAELVEPLRAGDREMVQVTTVHRRKDASLYPVEVHLELMAGDPPVFVAIINDITERKQAEAELSLKNLVFEYAISANSMSDTAGIITHVNEAFIKTWGYESKNEAIGKPISDFLRTEDEAKKIITALHETGAWEGEYTALRKDGTTFSAYGLATVIPDESGGVLGYQSAVLDITGRKRTEEELRAARELAQQYLEVVGVMLVVLDSAGLVTLVNRAGCEVLEYKKEDLLGKNWFDTCLPTEVVEGVKGVFHQLMSEEIEAVEYYENPVRTSSGTQRIIAWHNSILRNADGKPVGVLSSGEDITERRKAEDALRIERDNLRNVFEAMEDGVYIVNQQYDIQYVNPVLVNDFGSFENQKCYAYFHDRDDVCPWCKNADVIAGRTVRWEWHSLKNQKTYDLIDTPLKNSDGSISKLEIFRDITERKRAEEALIHSHDLMSYVIEHSNSAVAVHDRDLKYIYVSQHYLREYRVKEADVIGKHHYDVFPDLPQKWRDVHQRVLAGETLRAEDDPYVREDGTVDWTRWECRPWYEADGSVGGIIVYTEVITERKRAVEELRTSEQRLRGLAARLEEVREEERTAIARDLHDDLGQKLTGLRLDLESLALQLPANHTDLLASVESLSSLAEECINTTQTLSADLRPPMLDMLGLGSAVEWYTRAYAARSGLACEMDLPATEIDMHRKPATALFRILQEALTNVVRHAKATRVRVALREEKGVAVLEVTDDGIGMPKQEETTVAPLGILGMSERAEAYGGILKVERSTPLGTRVEAKIPMREPDPTPETATGDADS